MTGRTARLDARWLARLKRGLDQPPVHFRLALDLVCAGRPAARIGSVEPARHCRCARAAGPGASSGSMPPGIDPVLARIAL